MMRRDKIGTSAINPEGPFPIALSEKSKETRNFPRQSRVGCAKAVDKWNRFSGSRKQ